ncbi:MAG: thermonuclease family protein [Bacteroidota bacterium]
MKLLLFISLLMVSCYSKNNNAKESEFSGKVIKIVDGDTYDILFDNQSTQRIRMEGIDAPERGMAFYRVAKDYLGELCFGQTVWIKQTNTDRYGRMVAKTYLADGMELGLLMIEAGYAWHFKKYSSDLQLANAEIKARSEKLGLWVDKNPIAPWEYRK